MGEKKGGGGQVSLVLFVSLLLLLNPQIPGMEHGVEKEIPLAHPPD
jgi:hypothetical protein